MKKEWMNFKLLNIVLLLIIIFLLYLMKDLWFGVISKIFDILLPFLLGFIIAYVLYPLQKKLERGGLSKGFSILFISIILVSLITAFVLFVIPNVLPLFYEQIISILDTLSDFVGAISTQYNIDLSAFQDYINGLNDNMGNTVANGAFTMIGESLSILSISLIAMITSIYFLVDMDSIRKWFKKFVGPRNHKTFRYFEALDNGLYQYLNGLGSYVIVQFLEYTIIFYLIGHPNYLLLGLFAIFSALIPYFGGIIMMVIALLSASLVSTNLLILTAIIALIMPNVDAYFTSPKIFKKSNSIPGLLTIFGVFTGGVLYGVVGIIIAIPAIIIIITTLRFYSKEIVDKIDDIKEII